MRISLFLLLVLASCSIIPKEKTQQSSVATAENINATNQVVAKHVVEGQKRDPLPNMTITGDSNAVQVYTGAPAREAVPIPYRETTEYALSTSQSSETHEKTAAASSVTIPLGVKLALMGVGLLILAGSIFAIVTVLKRNSAAASAAFGAADQILARATDRAKDAATKAMDPHMALHHTTEALAIEKERSNLKDQAP